MLRLHRCVAVTLIVCFTLTATGVASAQTPASDGVQAAQPTTTSTADTMAAGLINGQMLAEGRATGGRFGAGLGVGLLTGLIGTGIGYFVTGPDAPSAEVLLRGQGRSADYQLGLRTGWEQKTKSKKRNAFLAGGLLGTAAFVAMVVAAQSGQ